MPPRWRQVGVESVPVRRLGPPISSRAIRSELMEMVER